MDFTILILERKDSQQYVVPKMYICIFERKVKFVDILVHQEHVSEMLTRQ